MRGMTIGRRSAAALVLMAPLSWLYASVGPVGGPWWVVPSAVATGLLAAVLLASYLAVPGSGKWLDLGCSPCAVTAAATTIGALVLRSSSPTDPGIALLALALVGFGLAQRRTGVSACAVPATAQSTWPDAHGQIEPSPAEHPVLARQLTSAESALDELARGVSLCELGRAGAPDPRLKAAEGAVAALTDVARVARNLPSDPTSLAALVGRHAEKWASQRSRRAADSPEWAAYLTAGEDALRRLATDLTAQESGDLDREPVRQLRSGDWAGSREE